MENLAVRGLGVKIFFLKKAEPDMVFQLRQPSLEGKRCSDDSDNGCVVVVIVVGRGQDD
jgi:hypothetical protein